LRSTVLFVTAGDCRAQRAAACWRCESNRQTACNVRAGPVRDDRNWSGDLFDSNCRATLTDGSGAVVERDSYDAWGLRRNADGSDNATCSITSQTTRGLTA